MELIQGKGWAASSKEVLTGFKDAHKRSPLHFAAAQGRRKVITYILDVAPEYVAVCCTHSWCVCVSCSLTETDAAAAGA